MRSRWDSRHQCAMDRFGANQNIWAKAGFDLISTKRSADQSVSSTTQPCRRLAVIMADECFFSGSVQDLGQHLYWAIASSNSNSEIYLTVMAASLKTISANLVWRASARK